MRPLLVTAILSGVGLYQPARACPDVVPVPATQPDIQCYTIDKPTSQRCATAINPTVCNFLNTTALNESLVTQDGFDYLGTIGFCAMVNNFGDGDKIYDFCPAGCFAADTNVLTGLTLNGKASYAAAASVRPQSTLMSMTDDATLGDVVLGAQTVKRTVFGPEDQPLFVFTLANGSTLRVTEHHPMVLDSGKIVEAAQVASGMSFVGLDGQSVSVSTVTREKATADVFNFETAGEAQLNHIIVAEGVLVGDLKLQNALANEEGSIGLRR
jgi:hypothetical protein